MVAAAVFIVAFAVAKANQCSGGGECPGGNKPNNVLSMLQTNLQMDALKDKGGDQMAEAQQIAAGRGAAVEGAVVRVSSSQSPNGSLFQVQKDTSPTRSSLAEVDSRMTAALDSRLRVEKRKVDSRIGSQPFEGKREPHVCIVARTCGPHVACAPGPGNPHNIVRAFLASIASQEYDSWELHLINGQGGGDVFQKVVDNIGDSRISNGPTSPEIFSSNTWGYEATNYAIEKMLDYKVPCEYFLFTNADNLYARGFLKTGLAGMRAGLDLLGENFVTRYLQPTEHMLGKNYEHMPMLEAGFKMSHIDLGAVLVSAKPMKAGNIRFKPENNITTDWTFFETILNRSGGKSSTFSQEVHFIHQ